MGPGRGRRSCGPPPLARLLATRLPVSMGRRGFRTASRVICSLTAAVSVLFACVLFRSRSTTADPQQRREARTPVCTEGPPWAHGALCGPGRRDARQRVWLCAPFSLGGTETSRRGTHTLTVLLGRAGGPPETGLRGLPLRELRPRGDFLFTTRNSRSPLGEVGAPCAGSCPRGTSHRTAHRFLSGSASVRSPCTSC